VRKEHSLNDCPRKEGFDGNPDDESSDVCDLFGVSVQRSDQLQYFDGLFQALSVWLGDIRQVDDVLYPQRLQSEDHRFKGSILYFGDFVLLSAFEVFLRVKSEAVSRTSSARAASSLFR
jgi:hypothetical protein